MKMTIVTNPLFVFVKKSLILTGFQKKNKLAEEPLVENEKNAEKESCNDNIESGKSAHQYYVLHSNGRRVASLATVCMLVIVLLVTGIGLTGGLYLYQQARQSKVRYSCQMPYSLFQSITSANYKQHEKVDHGLSSGPLSEAFFKVEFEIDPENSVENIKVPSIGTGRSALFVNDFTTNKTGIIDEDRKCCFTMTLDRKVVALPHSLMDFVRTFDGRFKNIHAPVYRKVVRREYPASQDLSPLGTHIEKRCRYFVTYSLKAITFPVVKRSTSEAKLQYVAPAGLGLLDVEIFE